MKCFIFLLIFADILGYVNTECTCQTSVALCPNIRKCQNCGLDEDQEDDYGEVHEDVRTEEDCLNLLVQSDVINAVQWKDRECTSINCENVLIEPDNEGETVYWKTCDSGCNFTVTEFVEKRVSSATNETLSISDEETCFRKCLSPLSQDCMVTYNDDSKTCNVYRGCNATQCQLLQSASNVDLYMLSCNEGCGSPTKPANGSVSFLSATVNSLATYNCDAGFLLNGSTNTTCQANGNWSSSPPTCTKVNCGQPSSPANGYVNYTGTLYGNQAMYGCNLGFNISGQSISICHKTGLWVTPVPECRAPGQTVKRKPLYILPCLCYPNKLFTGMTQDEILAYLENATSIDTKNTSAALGKLRCRSDSRKSSAVIGTVGIVILSTLGGLIVCLDLLTICRKNTRNSNRARK